MEGPTDGTNLQIGEGFSFTTILNQTRSPIFYDSNNTGYYVDPSGTTNLNTLEVGTGPGGNGAGNLYIQGNHNWRWIAGYAPDYGVGNGFGLYSDTNGAYYLSLSTSGNWWFGVNDHSSSYRVSINGTGYASSDFRAPIFYDSGNTAYYVDPASTSNLLGLTVTNTITGTASGNIPRSGSWLGDLASYGYTREHGISMTGGSEFVILSKSGQGYTLVDGSYFAYEGGGFYSSSNSAGNTLLGFTSDTTSSLNFNTTTVKLSGNQILHAGNYNSYAPTLTGTGASGTWGINVTGSAGSANILGTTRNINGTGFNGSANIDTTEWFHSDRDFPSGTLITTNIDYSVTYGDPFVLEIRGNSYGNIIPLDLQYQGYIYNDTIINHGGLSNGLMITGLVAINNGGNLCFWFPSQGYWNGYNVKVYVAYATRAVNRVTSITGTGKPTTAKEVALTAQIRQSLHSGNYTSYAPSLTGSGASGTWGIAITGNAASATTATNQSGGTVSATTGTFTGNITVSSGNATGGGIILADDGDIVDLNDAYCSMRFSAGVRIFSANRGGTASILLGNGGNIVAIGNITAYGSASDITLKENIVKFGNALSIVNQLNGYYFNYIGKEDRLVGVIAQEVEKVLPELVYTFKPLNTDEDKKAVKYELLSAVLIEAIKEQQTQIENQSSEISELKSMINMLVDKVNKLID